MKIKFKKLSAKQIVAIIVAILVVFIVSYTGIYCGVNSVTPTQMVTDITTPNDEQIIGKWLNETDGGATAYEFMDDGTVGNYVLSNTPYTTNYVYSVDGNKLTIHSVSYGKSVVYKFSIHGDTLTMQAVENDGFAYEGDEYVYKRVNKLNVKDIWDIVQDIGADSIEEQTTDSEADSTESTTDSTDTTE